MHIAYDILQNAQPGQMIYMVAGAKDAKRFENVAAKYVPEGVNLNVEPMPNVMDPDTKKPMRATDFREAIEVGKDILKYIPETSFGSVEQIISTLQPSKNESISTSLIFDLIYEAIDPRSKVPPAEQAAEEVMAGVQEFTPQVMNKVEPALGDMFKDFGEDVTGELGNIIGGTSEELAGMVGGTMEELVKIEMEKERMAKRQRSEQERADAEGAIARGVPGMMSELSAVAAVQGAPGNKKKKKHKTIFREEEENNELIETIMNYLLQNSNSQGAI